MTLQCGTGIELHGYGILQLSPDGYVRLTLEQFQAIVLRHLWSGLDQEDSASLHEGEGAILTRITGYTEWVSETVPAISLGWDWQLQELSGQARYFRVGSQRSNIMLIDSLEHDLGPIQTDLLLGQSIDKMAWQEVVKTQITSGHAWQAVNSDS